MKLRVYGKGVGCPQCTQVKLFLDNNNVEYDFFDVLDPEDGEDFTTYIKEHGYAAVPVIFTNETESFQGFQPDKLEALVNA